MAELSNQPIQYKGERVLTLDTVDRIHGTKSNARHSFYGHEEQFQEGIDYFRVPYVEWSQWVADCTPEVQSKSGGYRGEKIVLTKHGYLNVIKPMKDQLTWHA